MVSVRNHLTDESDEDSAPARAPISTHRAFPVIVALWFAALLGFGSLVVPVPLLERLSLASGLAGIVPAAAPPLGFTARALMALAFTVGGALAGLLIARQVARAHGAEPEPLATIAGSRRRPISAIDELGDEGLDGHSLTGRSRGLAALAVEPAPVEDLRPMPAPVAPPRDIGLTAWMPDAEPEGSSDEDPAIHDLDEFELTEDLLAEDLLAIESSAEDADPFVTNPVPGFSALATGDAPVLPREPVEDEAVEDDTALAFSPPSLARDEAEVGERGADADEDEYADWADEEEPAEAVIDLAPEDHGQFAAPAEATVLADALAGHDAARGLEDLGLLQLVQRLATSMESHRTARAERDLARASAAADPAVARPPSPTASVVPFDEDFVAARPEDAAEAMAAWFAPANANEQQQPAEGHPSPDVAADIAEQASSAEPSVDRRPLPPAMRQVFIPVEPEPEFSHDAEHFAALADVVLFDEEEDEDQDDDFAGFAASFSLPLSGSAQDNPFHSAERFVRIEDEADRDDAMGEPAVVFPGGDSAPAPADAAPRGLAAEEQERALREALLNLQRMSGAA